MPPSWCNVFFSYYIFSSMSQGKGCSHSSQSWDRMQRRGKALLSPKLVSGSHPQSSWAGSRSWSLPAQLFSHFFLSHGLSKCTVVSPKMLSNWKYTWLLLSRYNLTAIWFCYCVTGCDILRSVKHLCHGSHLLQDGEVDYSRLCYNIIHVISVLLSLSLSDPHHQTNSSLHHISFCCFHLPESHNSLYKAEQLRERMRRPPRQHTDWLTRNTSNQLLTLH